MQFLPVVRSEHGSALLSHAPFLPLEDGLALGLLLLLLSASDSIEISWPTRLHLRSTRHRSLLQREHAPQ
ncbi:hypothetical protein WT55_21405 [Burkholderia pseudomultivorans]|nr:hypothetical protein WT55_21405 [Burkholderia pseudomultivorans]